MEMGVLYPSSVALDYHIPGQRGKKFRLVVSLGVRACTGRLLMCENDAMGNTRHGSNVLFCS